MDTAEWLTRGTVWLALTLYVAAELAMASKPGPAANAIGRWLSGIGVTAFAGHVVCAFHFHHDWSHAAAYSDTARQTMELTGWNWGGGLYVNYAFALVWLGELIWWWASPTTHARRPQWIGALVRGFFMFMILNGAVVFVKGPMRWYGLTLCVLLATAWWQRSKPSSRIRTSSPGSSHE